MPVSRPGPDGPTTESEFEDNLSWLLRQAHANSVGVEGGWDYRTADAEYPDWGIEIYRVTERTPTMP
ncbi:MAG: hypothetical protein ABEJ89_05885 [Haloarculaceae archaeon]